MKRYYITDRRTCSDVLQCIERAAACGVEYIQIREKDLSARDLLALTRQAVGLAHRWGGRVLVNERVDVAVAGGADGVHLPASSIAPSVWRSSLPRAFLIGLSCHRLEDLKQVQGSDFVVYGPVFTTPGKGSPVGLQSLRTFTNASPIPVFALGGIDEQNAQLCIDNGAHGIAAIRLFQR